jgi:hypothetical protein
MKVTIKSTSNWAFVNNTTARRGFIDNVLITTGP